MVKAVVPARGMRDTLPFEKRRRDAVLDVIRSTYRGFGFTEIETPALETLDRLRSNQGGENESMLFEVLKRGLPREEPVLPADAADLALRYDLTLPLTRFYASNAAELPTVFRSLQTGPVWRAERPQKGRYRQFTQCDIDVIGEPGQIAEVDLLIATLTAFERLGMGSEITLMINDRRTLQGLMEAAGFEASRIPEALISLDKLDKIDVAGVRAEMLRREIAPDEVVDRLLASIETLRGQRGPEDAPLRDGSFTVPGGAASAVSLHELPSIVRAVRAVLPWAKVVFDVSLVRGMGYYTGPIFEIAHSSTSSSVAGGGRYDGVVGKWLGRDVPACGFSIGFERIIDLVDLPEATRRRIALFYDDASEPADLMRLRGKLQEDDAEVALTRPPRKLSSRYLDGLAAEGFTHLCDPRNGVADAPLRELRPQEHVV